jgi:hypothetical protein
LAGRRRLRESALRTGRSSEQQHAHAKHRARFKDTKNDVAHVIPLLRSVACITMVLSVQVTT